jgi:hypothetical protein
MKLDGGSNAIRGFNYQKAVITFIAVLNYNKDDFEFFIENQDDVEVFFKDSHTFIQIKSNKSLSIKNLVKADKKTNQSILSKNLSKNANGSRLGRYKIIAPDFQKSDKSNLEEYSEGLIFDTIYKYSDSQRLAISDSLKDQGYKQNDSDLKLSNSYLFFSPFGADLIDAIRSIKGTMSDHNISVDNNKGNIAINELFTQIDFKSEISPTKEMPYNNKKKLTSRDLKIIFTISGHEIIQERIWNHIKSNFNLLTQQKIEREFIRAISMHKALKNDMVNKIGSFTADSDTNSLVKDLYEKVKIFEFDDNVLYALIVVIIAEKIQEELLCS